MIAKDSGKWIENPHAYLKVIPLDDYRWDKFNEFWKIEAGEPYRNIIHRLRKQRSKQMIIAILNGSYTKGNIEITSIIRIGSSCFDTLVLLLDYLN